MNTTNVTLYRATDDDYPTQPTAFAAEIESAREYLDNPGFGGSTLYRTTVEVDADEVLDVRSERDDAQLAALVRASGRAHPGAMTADMYAMQPSTVEGLVAAGYRWVRIIDTYPVGSETWIWLISSAGVDMGIYEGETEADALDAMALDAGYRDQAHAAEVAGPFEGTVAEVERPTR